MNETISNKSPYFPLKHNKPATMHCAHNAQAGTAFLFNVPAFLKNNPSCAIV